MYVWLVRQCQECVVFLNKYVERTATKIPLILGTKRGVCPACKKEKKLLVLWYGLTVCESCLKDLIQILELAKDGVSKEELVRCFGAVDDVEKLGKSVKADFHVLSMRHRGDVEGEEDSD